MSTQSREVLAKANDCSCAVPPPSDAWSMYLWQGDFQHIVFDGPRQTLERLRVLHSVAVAVLHEVPCAIPPLVNVALHRVDSIRHGMKCARCCGGVTGLDIRVRWCVCTARLVAVRACRGFRGQRVRAERPDVRERTATTVTDAQRSLACFAGRLAPRRFLSALSLRGHGSRHSN